MRSSPQLTIGQLATEFGLEPHVLRHWEAEGVLHPACRVGGKRRYEESARTRIRTIIAAKDAGMSLAQIRDVFETESGPERQAKLSEQLRTLEQRQRDIALSIAALEHLRTCDRTDFAACPGFLAATEQQA